MSAWERLVREMRRKRKSFVSLADALGTSKGNINHWKQRGIPQKYMRQCAEFVGCTLEWLEFGDSDRRMPLEEALRVLAEHLQAAGDYDKATVVALFTTLAHSPHMYEVVHNGLAALHLGKPSDS